MCCRWTAIRISDNTPAWPGPGRDVWCGISLFIRVAPSSCYSVINNINNNIDVKRYHLIDYCKSRSISKAIQVDDDCQQRQPDISPARYHRLVDGLLLFPGPRVCSTPLVVVVVVVAYRLP